VNKGKIWVVIPCKYVCQVNQGEIWVVIPCKYIGRLNKGEQGENLGRDSM